MEVVDALLEEYKTVRQESLEAAGRLQSVSQYLLAAMGVVITVAVLAADQNRTLGAGLVMLLTPISVVFGTAMMTLEIQRMVGPRRYMRGLERRINALLVSAEDPGLGWETNRIPGGFRPLNPFPVAFGTAVVGIAAAAPAIGGLILHDDLTTLYWLGVAADVVVGTVLAVVFWRFVYPTIRDMERDVPI
jgi:uncharacterized membrane protein